jgi:hypothetical protein
MIRYAVIANIGRMAKGRLEMLCRVRLTSASPCSPAWFCAILLQCAKLGEGNRKFQNDINCISLCWAFFLLYSEDPF